MGKSRLGERIYQTQEEAVDKIWELYEYFYNKHGKKA